MRDWFVMGSGPARRIGLVRASSGQPASIGAKCSDGSAGVRRRQIYYTLEQVRIPPATTLSSADCPSAISGRACNRHYIASANRLGDE